MPTDIEMLVLAARGLVRKPARAIVLATRTIRELGAAIRNPVVVEAANQIRGGLRGPVGAVLNIGRARVPEGEVKGPLPSGAPKTPWNASITAHRRFAYRSVSLTEVKAIKNAMGATVNDVVMAVCAGGLRTWLETHDALPDLPLVAMIPVSVRTGEESEKWTNRVSAIFATIPTDEPDPVQRVARVHSAMVGAKSLHDAVPAEALTDFAQFPPPIVFARAVRTATRLGARFQLQMLHYYPVSTIVDGQGLNITVQSYLDTLDFGVIACRELVPDVWAMTDMIVDDLRLLGKAVGVVVS
jgi:hypothetical protein